MQQAHGIANHWDTGDVYGRILAALAKAGKALDGLTVEDLAPVDHYHARGLAATVDLADRLAVTPQHHLLDIGCGLGGPARYFAARFGCTVSGIDITPAFVEAARKLTLLLDMPDKVAVQQGDGCRLPYPDASFDGAYALHVTMNVADRRQFFGEACRVLKPGAVFALTEHGLGPAGNPHFPVPWSSDGSGSYLASPADTRTLLEAAGFAEIQIDDTGQQYLEAYKAMSARAAQGNLPPLGLHILVGESMVDRTHNAARNIAEGRTRPVRVLCRKPA